MFQKIKDPKQIRNNAVATLPIVRTVTMPSTLNSTYPVSTVTNSGTLGSISYPFSVCLDPTGKIMYIADQGYFKINKLDLSSNTLSHLAGSGAKGHLDGTATTAQFSFLAFMCIDSIGSYLYVYTVGPGEVAPHKIRKVNTSTGDVITLNFTYLNAISNLNICCIRAGTNLYVNSPTAIYKISNLSSGTQSFVAIAGLEGTSDYLNGNNTVTRFKNALCTCVDATESNLYVVDSGTIRRINLLAGPSSNQYVTAICGTYGTFGTTNGASNVALFPSTLRNAITDSEYIYISDENSNSIRKINISTGFVEKIAGTGSVGSSDSTTGTSASFKNQIDIVINPFNQILYVADPNNKLIRKINLPVVNYTTTTVVKYPANNIRTPYGICTDPTGEFIYTSYYTQHCIYKISTLTYAVTVIGGIFGTSGNADGTVGTSKFNLPLHLCMDPTGTYIYVCDHQNNAIRKITVSTNTVSTVATISSPFGICINQAGTALYVTAYSNNVIYKITQLDSSPISTIIAGINGTAGSANGQLGTSTLNGPGNICVDSTESNLYVCCDDNTVRKIQISNNYNTSIFVGQYLISGNTDGSGNMATFRTPRGLALDLSGEFLYVSEIGNHNIRKINTSTGYTTTIIGKSTASGGISGSTDGSPETALLNWPVGIVFDPTYQYLYIADTNNEAIRRTQLNTTTTISYKKLL